MALINDTPDDVILSILEVCSHCSILNISKVNKRFHVLAASRLYRAVNWTWEIDSSPPILLLLRTILTRPDLSRHIRVIKLNGWSIAHRQTMREKPLKISLDSIGDELDAIVVAVEEIQRKLGMSPERPNLLVEEFRAGTMDALLSVLLSQLLNLTHLHLEPSFLKEVPLLAFTLKKLLCVPKSNGEEFYTGESALSTFECLQKVVFTAFEERDISWYEKFYAMDRNITWGTDRRNILYTAFLPFLYAPRIQQICGFVDEPCIPFKWLSWDENENRHSFKDTDIPPPVAKTLEHLDISLLREASLNKILAQCPNLKSLKWKFQTNPDRVAPPPFLDCKLLGTALENVKGTLTSLVLRLHFTQSHEGGLDDPERTPAHGIQSTLQNLGSFPLLTTLEIPYVILLGLSPSSNGRLQGLLPFGLRLLTLTDDLYYEWSEADDVIEWEDEKHLFVVIEEFLQDWRLDVPRLQKFVLLLRKSDHAWPPSLREKVMKLGENAGLEIEVVKLKKDLGV